MQGGMQTGLLTVIKYKNSFIGPYSELLFSPGKYDTAADCGGDGLQHVARIWVDSPFSQRAGRNIWGMPKELATFDWSTGPGWVKVSVKDNKSNKLIFEAKMADVPLPRPLQSKGMQLVSAFVQDAAGCIASVQLPIDDNIGKTEYADVAAFSTAQKAFKAKPMGRLTTKVCYSTASGTVSKVTHSFMNGEAWTGHSQESPSLMPFAVRLPSGTTAQLTAPELCQPAAAAAAAAAAASGGSRGGAAAASGGGRGGSAVATGRSSIAFPFFG
ncbi:hypothetical protein OEZ85_005157 [Tetradesmus obliquus]|uniref:Uncharacterized protein n=1 Tax=Tetradesmus obliquus TaxID=3088 RepID=A0ABY8UH00_TETOB|nr:hypothetical protein OEZ85_005157 [Tetradesmus obliquus]